MLYRNASSDDVRAAYAEAIAAIEAQGLLYPVTLVDGMPVYDGAVSYPAIMRAVHNKLAERGEAAS